MVVKEKINKVTKDESNKTLSAEEDVRLPAVIHLAETCDYEVEHTNQVTWLALHLFDELYPLHKLNPHERSWLHYAALLHDIGWVEGRKEHHKTALRIILSTPLLSFDSKERLIIGSIARYHRRSLPNQNHDNFASLDPEEQNIVMVLSAILRFADGLDSMHQNRVREIECKINKQQLKVTCSVLKVIPGESLITSEKGDLLELVFKRKLVLVYKKYRNE